MSSRDSHCNDNEHGRNAAAAAALTGDAPAAEREITGLQQPSHRERHVVEAVSITVTSSVGAAAGYSISSGSDRWKLFKEQTEDRPIQPVGLTAAEEAETLYREIQAMLKEKGGPAHFWYPARDMSDLCEGLEGGAPIPAALQCTAQEIDWATRGSEKVEGIWIPSRLH